MDERTGEITSLLRRWRVDDREAVDQLVPLVYGELNFSSPQRIDLLDLDRALERLREREPQVERLVELRFLAGLTIEESGVVMKRSEASLSRYWALARTFLSRELQRAPAAV